MVTSIQNFTGDLSTPRVLQLLQISDNEICHLPPVRPKAGDIFVYEPVNEGCIGMMNKPFIVVI